MGEIFFRLFELVSSFGSSNTNYQLCQISKSSLVKVIPFSIFHSPPFSKSFLYIADSRTKNTHSPCTPTHNGYGVFIRNRTASTSSDPTSAQSGANSNMVATLSDETDLPIGFTDISQITPSPTVKIVYKDSDDSGGGWAVAVLIVLLCLLGICGAFLVYYNKKTGYVTAVIEWHRAWRSGHRVRVGPSGQVLNSFFSVFFFGKSLSSFGMGNITRLNKHFPFPFESNSDEHTMHDRPQTLNRYCLGGLDITQLNKSFLTSRPMLKM